MTRPTAEFARRPAPKKSVYNLWFFLIFSVAVCRIVARPGSRIDIDSILPHAKRHVQYITMCEDPDPRSSSHETQNYDFREMHIKHTEKHMNAATCSTSPLAVTRLTVYRQLHMVRSTLLQVSIGRQTAPRGGPPVDGPGPPLDTNISGSRSPNETSRVLVIIIFDALSHGVNAISQS